MSWHFEVLTINARRFLEGQSYWDRDPFASILTLQFKNQKEAYISGLLNDSVRGPIARADWRELRDDLRRVYSVDLITGEHNRDPLSIPTGPAPLI